MSHFTVLIFGDNAEQQLAPFQENNMGNCPEEYMSFNDKEDEYLAKYQTETVTRVVMPDGRLLFEYDEEFRIPGTFGMGTNTHTVPENLKKIEIPFTQMYSSFEIFMADYAGYQERDETTGRYGYYENPNARWDWYKLGGRWTGFFKLKPGHTGEKGSPGLMTPPAKPGYADRAYKKHIDFEGMRNSAVDVAAKEYDFVWNIIKDLPKSRSWKEIAEPLNYNKEAREIYNEQPRVKAMREAELKDRQNWPLGMFASPEDFDMTREEYIENARNGAITTHAVIKDGKWYERGEMGWWAVVSNKKDDIVWNEEFAKLLDEASEDTIISVYDCHI